MSIQVSSIPFKKNGPFKVATIFENTDAPNGKDIILVSPYYADGETFQPRKDPWGNVIPRYGISDAAVTVLNQFIVEKEVRSITLYPLERFSILDVESGERKARFETTFQNLKALIKKRKQDLGKLDGIAFSGFWKLSDKYENEFDATLFGRIVEYEGIPALHTISINAICPDKKGEDSANNASLIGFFWNHMEILLEGKDRYTVRTDNWNTILVNSIEKFDKMMEDIRTAPVSAWDTETTGLSRTQEKLLTIQIATNANTAYILPYQHKETPFNQEELDYIKKTFKEYFERGKAKFHIYQNAKFDIAQFITHFELQYYNFRIYDLMGGCFQENENRKFLSGVGIQKPYSLGFLAKEYGAGNIFEEGELGKDDRTDLANQSLEDIAEYGAKDVIIPYQIAHFQIKDAKRRGDKGFMKVVCEQLSNMIYCFAVMEHNGFLVDKKYLMELTSKDSALTKGMRDIEAELKTLPSVQKANDLLLEKAGLPLSGGLTGMKKWIFDINKEESQQALFYGVLNITPLRTKKNGGGALGKDFKEHYKKDYKEVALLDTYDKIKKVKSTFIDGHFERYKTDKDLRTDNRMRSSYGFTGVVTGRASSSDPNLQQIPSRGDYAAAVKRQFIVPSNNLIVHADYSAHEVRNWGNVSKDERISNIFNQGKFARKKLRYYFSSDLEIWEQFRQFQLESKWVVPKGSDEKALDYEQKKALIPTIEDKKLRKISELMFELENKGDVHKLNYEFFFGVPAYLVNKQQRQSVKNVVFGVIYGKGAQSLAEDINGTEEEAQAIMDKLFEKFENGGNWIHACHDKGRKQYEVHSPIGRVRHLCAYRHPGFGIKASMDRKGPNSCIQGFSSDIGFDSGKIMQDLCWNWFWKRGIDFGFTYMNVVHDSTETQVRVRHIPIVAYMMEHAYSTLVHRKLRDYFGFELTCGFETEMDVGGSQSEMYTIENFCELERYVKKAIKWSMENLQDWKLEPGEWKAFKTNLQILDKIRKQELKESYGKPVDYDMYLNEDNILEQGLIL